MGTGELGLIALLALLILKPEQIPKVATSLGRFLGQLRRSFEDVKTSMNEELRNNPINSWKDDIKRSVSLDSKKKGDPKKEKESSQ